MYVYSYIYINAVYQELRENVYMLNSYLYWFALLENCSNIQGKRCMLVTYIGVVPLANVGTFLLKSYAGVQPGCSPVCVT